MDYDYPFGIFKLFLLRSTIWGTLFCFGDDNATDPQKCLMSLTFVIDILHIPDYKSYFPYIGKNDFPYSKSNEHYSEFEYNFSHNL